MRRGTICDAIGLELIDKLAGMKAAAIGIKVFDELFGRHAGVERVLVTKVMIPKFVNCVADELGGGPFGGFERRVIPDKDSMFRFAPCPDDRCGIVGDDGVCRVVNRDQECCAPGCGIQCGWFDDTNEVVCSRFVVRDFKEKGVEDLAESGEVIVCWLANDRLE
jgi:hypothetical protein